MAILTAISAVARPILVEGAKEGVKALVAAGVVYGAIGAGVGLGYGAYRGGRKVVGKVGTWRHNRQAAKAAAVEAAAEQPAAA